jgi:NAD(P)-dependent dehydrogenase (short-subunit alcohol dehydrogenase family)
METESGSRPADRFAGHVAIVTGGTRGIGAAVVRQLVEGGARVVVVARGATDGNGALDDLDREMLRFVEGDVADPGTARRALSDCVDAFGAVSILINNAGVDFAAGLFDASLDDVRRVLNVNFIGAWLFTVTIAPTMRAGGSIVNITSRTASVGVPTMSVYGASKGALASFSRCAAIELAAAGVRVNVVAPGTTDTSLIRDWIEAQDHPRTFERGVVASIPLGHLAHPDRVAAAVLFLASEEAADITGATLAVDGGYTAA